MFGIGMPELILIFAVALIVLGPKRLPEIARALGKGIFEFRRTTQDLKEELRQVEDELEDASGSVNVAENSILNEETNPTEDPSPATNPPSQKSGKPTE